MKRSELKQSIKEEIIDILETASKEDVETQKAYNAELEKSAKLMKDAGLDEGNDRDYRDDGYVDKKDVDDTTDLYVHNDPESMAFETKSPVVAKGDGIEITQDEMDKLRKDGRVKLKDGSILVFPKKPLKEEDDDEMDKKASAAAKKGDSVSKIANKLQQTTKEMKQVVKKWKTSEGAEKEKLKNRLRDLTKIKKELEGLL
jgi:predicted HicB family RNase H-like nuclease